jgi:hypothetical protein
VVALILIIFHCLLQEHFSDFIETNLASALGADGENLILSCSDRTEEGSVIIEVSYNCYIVTLRSSFAMISYEQKLYLLQLVTTEVAGVLCQLDGLEYGNGISLSFRMESTNKCNAHIRVIPGPPQPSKRIVSGICYFINNCVVLL